MSNNDDFEFKNSWNTLCSIHLKARQKKLNEQIEKVKIIWEKYIKENLFENELSTYSLHQLNHPSSDKLIKGY